MNNDDVSHKVISIFQRHHRGEPLSTDSPEAGELVMSPDGFNYVSIKQDAHGVSDESALRDVASKKHYIVKMMEMHHDTNTLRLNNYDIPGDRLEEFLLGLQNRPGKLLEIRQFIPDTMA